MEKSHSLTKECSNADDVIIVCIYLMSITPRNFIEIRSCAMLGDSTSWTGFLVISRSMEAICFLFLDWKLRKVFIGWYMVSLSLYVIMQVLLADAFIVQQIVQILAHWFLARKSCCLMTKKGKIALSTTKNNFSLSLLPFLLFAHFNWTMLLYYFWNAEGVSSSVREVWFLQDVDREIQI